MLPKLAVIMINGETNFKKNIFAQIFWEFLLKKDYNTGFFLRILQNLQERLFYRTLPLAASRIYFLHLGPLILSFKKKQFS